MEVLSPHKSTIKPGEETKIAPILKRNKREAQPDLAAKCEPCQTAYKTEEQLKQHKKTPEHKQTEKEKAQAANAARRQHREESKSQQKNDLAFTCDQCTRSFKSKIALE